MVLGGSSRSRQLAASMTANAASSLVAKPAPSGPALADKAIYGTPSRAQSVLAGLPLMFEPNQGQANLDPADPRAKFLARGPGYSLLLGKDGAMLSLTSISPSKRDAAKPALRSEWLQMKLAGADPNVRLTAADPLPGKSNYMLGNDPAKWRQGIPQFARVSYENVYPGINLVFYGNQGALEYDFQVEPGSDPSRAELEFDGAKGLELQDGALVVKGEGGSVRFNAPRVYQEIAGRQQPVEGGFVLRGARRAGFAIGTYDHSRELVIDPFLSFSTYFGGSGNELNSSIFVDGSGNIYLTGSTTSPNLPVTTGVIQTALKAVTAQNIYIAKITPPLGSIPAGLDYVTYLGGSDVDSPVGIAADGAGRPYVAGTTTSPDFPTTPTAYQTTPQAGSTGSSHVFVTALNNTVTAPLLYSSYLSGSGTDIASGMTIDSQGSIYVTGTTTSTNPQDYAIGVAFPVTSIPFGLQPFQSTPRAPLQFFVTKVNTLSAGITSVLYSTYFGGGTFETTTPIAVGGGITVDTNQNIYFTGTTNFIYLGQNGTGLTDFPILNAYQPCLDVPQVTIIIGPQSCSTNASATESDAFAAKLNPAGPAGSGQLVWSTYLGGSQTDSGTGIALDTGAANVYITGTTNSPDVTTATSFAAYQRCLDTPVNPAAGTTCNTALTANDAFVARLTNPSSGVTTTNMALTYFSYLGGSGNEAGLAITVDSASGALLTGSTQSADFPVFPTPSPIQTGINGTQNAFVARLNTVAQIGNNTSTSWASYYGGSALDEGTSIALDVNQNVYIAGDTTSPNLHLAEQLLASQGGDYNGGSDAFVVQLGTASNLSITGCIAPCTTQTQPYVSAGTPVTFTYTLTNNGPDLASGITVTNFIGPSITIVPLTFDSATATSGTCSGSSTTTQVACTIPTLQSGSTATITFVLTPTATSNGGSASFNGGTVQVTGQNDIVLAQTSVPASMSDFSILASPSNFSVPAAGDTASYVVQLIPHPVYGSNVTLSCTGTPTGTACGWSAQTITLTGTSPGSSMLSISTTARPIVTPSSSLWTRHFYAIWLSVPGLALLGIGVGGDRRRRRIAGVLLLCAVFAMLLLQPACGKSAAQSPVSGTPTGTYTITVTATAGSDSKSASVTLTVP